MKLRSCVAFLAAGLRRAPLSIGCVLALWLLGAATGSLVHGPSDGLLASVGVGLPALAEGRWWTPFTSALWCSGLTSYLGTSALFLVLGMATERRLGSARTAWLLLVSHVGGALLGVGAVWLGSYLEEVWLSQLQDSLTVGPATALAGAGLALSFRLSTLWRRRLRLFLLLTLLIFALYIGYLQDVVQLAGGVVGLVVGLLLFGRTQPGRRHGPSHAETRVLVALVVAGAALGALAVALADQPIGPLSWYSFFFVSLPLDQDYLREVCADPTMAQLCQELRAEQAFDATPAAVLSMAPALLLLVLAEGLRRGRRFAWIGALGLNLLLITFAVWFNVSEVLNYPKDLGQSRLDFLIDTSEPLLLAVATVVVLLATRRHFELRMPARVLLRFWGLLFGVAGVITAAYLGVGYFLLRQFDPDPTFLELLRELPSRFMPPEYLGVFQVKYIPASWATRLLVGYSGLLFWLVVLGGLLLAFWRAHTSSEAGAAARAREVLVRFGGSSLSYMTMWEGNHYWFHASGQAAVAYRVVATIAITTGEPFGREEYRGEAAANFAAFCTRNGWTPCFYSVTEEGRKATDELGWKSVQVAEDTVLPLDTLAFTGKKWQDVRTALNNAAKAGITAQWYAFPTAPLPVTEQIREISEEWVADKGMPEMGFTLGGLDELDDPAVRCLVAVDGEGRVHGVTSWLPVYADGETVGWTLDFMRRGTTEFRGVMEFLIASAALGFKGEGATFLSLSGAPLARLDRGEQPGALQKLLDFTGRTLEPVYGFRSLLAFKAKFQPTYQPLYMAYADPAALPTIANAIARAYLPHLTPRQTLRLLRKVVG